MTWLEIEPPAADEFDAYYQGYIDGEPGIVAGVQDDQVTLDELGEHSA